MVLVMRSNDIKKYISFLTHIIQYELLSKKMSQIEKLTTEKGKSMLLYEGFIYTVERTTTTKLILRCHNRDCKGMVILNINQLIEIKIIY